MAVKLIRASLGHRAAGDVIVLNPELGAIVHDAARRSIGRQQKESQMAMQFRVVVEIEGSTPETFKIGFEFSDEEGSGIEFYSDHDLPENITEKLGALAIDFINDIGDLVLPKLH
jgi:hypothetical protein